MRVHLANDTVQSVSTRVVACTAVHKRPTQYPPTLLTTHPLNPTHAEVDEVAVAVHGGGTAIWHLTTHIRTHTPYLFMGAESWIGIEGGSGQNDPPNDLGVDDGEFEIIVLEQSPCLVLHTNAAHRGQYGAGLAV